MKEGGLGPVVESSFVDAGGDRVWHALTSEIGEWWPVTPVSVSGVAVEGLELDARVGGLLVEVWADGTRAPYAQIVAWEPPTRLVLRWNPGGGPGPATTVDVVLSDVAGGTQVRVAHSGWEALGEEARLDYVAGWPFVLDRLAFHVSRTGGPRRG